MPIYEYQCDHCGHQLEVIQKISDQPLVTCTACGQDALKKLVSASRFVLKGQGWYETDFKHSKTPDAGKQQAEQKNTEQDSKQASAAKDSAKDTTSKSEASRTSTKDSGTTDTNKKSTPSSEG